MVKTPELSVEDLQPLKDLTDAAILFSDILVIPKQWDNLTNLEGGGINTVSLESEDCVKKLETDKICESLSMLRIL